MKIKFLEAGKWADEPRKPVFDVEVGEVKEVTPELATIAIDAGRAVLYTEKAEVKPTETKPKRFGSKKAGPIPKAEG